jgi:hypothetical protein
LFLSNRSCLRITPLLTTLLVRKLLCPSCALVAFISAAWANIIVGNIKTQDAANAIRFLILKVLQTFATLRAHLNRIKPAALAKLQVISSVRIKNPLIGCDGRFDCGKFG